jgi:hypothetical protein
MEFLIGHPEHLCDLPVPVFDPARLAFLADLSSHLLSDSRHRDRPDVVTWAFWCRKANLARLAAQASDDRLRVGLGLVFHICPSNVPVNFAFSLAFGLLSGNSCVLRLPSADTPTLEVLLGAIAQVLARPQHAPLRSAVALVRYPHDDEVNAWWMSQADGRVIWGGDATVALMRSFPTPARSREVAFADRYSFCALGAKALNALTDADLNGLCARLFNDLYLMDQNACSSPHLVVWVGATPEVETARARLWAAFEGAALTKYSMAPIAVMDKFVQACASAVQDDDLQRIHRHGNALYRLELDALNSSPVMRRGHHGMVFEVSVDSIDAVAPWVDSRFQTLTYFGLDVPLLRSFLVRHRLRGIDRVVPVGKALDMGMQWDGYDLVSSLSRWIDIQ